MKAVIKMQAIFVRKPNEEGKLFFFFKGNEATFLQ